MVLIRLHGLNCLHRHTTWESRVMWIVISLIQKGSPLKIENGLLEDKTKKLLIQNILERLNRYEKYRGIETTLEQIIREQAHEIAAWIDGGKKYKPYIAKW